MDDNLDSFLEAQTQEASLGLNLLEESALMTYDIIQIQDVHTENIHKSLSSKIILKSMLINFSINKCELERTDIS